jgi:quercetin dioxygenase-like cupin family protein
MGRAWRRAIIAPNPSTIAVVIAGEIEMEIDGATVPLRQGDVLVRRGTIHNWNNHGTAPCVIAFVLIAATSVERAGRVLGAFG